MIGFLVAYTSYHLNQLLETITTITVVEKGVAPEISPLKGIGEAMTTVLNVAALEDILGSVASVTRTAFS